MSTHFVGEGNIGSAPDYREFPNGNDEPRRLLRLNVYFDNPIPKKDGEFEFDETPAPPPAGRSASSVSASGSISGSSTTR